MDCIYFHALYNVHRNVSSKFEFILASETKNLLLSTIMSYKKELSDKIDFIERD